MNSTQIISIFICFTFEDFSFNLSWKFEENAVQICCYWSERYRNIWKFHWKPKWIVRLETIFFLIVSSWTFAFISSARENWAKFRENQEKFWEEKNTEFKKCDEKLEESRKKLEDTGKTLEKLSEAQKMYSKKYDEELKEVELCRQNLEEIRRNWEKSRMDWEKSGQNMK